MVKLESNQMVGGHTKTTAINCNEAMFSTFGSMCNMRISDIVWKINDMFIQVLCHFVPFKEN